ncbi:MAG: DUF1883 domain-containing protein [Flavobacteriales bacterium]|nr:DUF1883 domain-containing protein [Flavobacteriales bacterium]
MRFLHGKVKANKGGKIKVSISSPTRVLIMNDRNYRRYKNNQTFTYYGGAKEGLYEFNVPSTNIYNVVVEKGSYARPIDIKVSIEVEKGVAKTHSVPRSLATTLDEADAKLDEQHEVATQTPEEEDDDA